MLKMIHDELQLEIQDILKLATHDPAKKLPEDNTYVLIYVPGRPWHDGDDPKGCFWKVAKFVRGISMAERAALPDTDPRKRRYKGADEQSNNERPYCWEEFGPGNFFGQEVTRWMELPR